VVTVWRNGRAHQAPFTRSRFGSLAWRAAASCLQMVLRLGGCVIAGGPVATVRAERHGCRIDRRPSR
jgi:hypothetical protein